MPLVIKGIMTPEDAELAISAGVDGIMVSNHGGRQLDGCLATIDALSPIAKVVAGRVPIWLDSGVRRGTVRELCRLLCCSKNSRLAHISFPIGCPKGTGSWCFRGWNWQARLFWVVGWWKGWIFLFA